MLPLNDKVVHFGLYFVLGAALAHGRRRSGLAWAHGLMWALGAVYGASDEWHQTFVEGRDASVADWVADCIGVAVGYAAWRRIGSRRGPEAARHTSKKDVENDG